MGKRIVSRARGHGSQVYRVRRQGYSYTIRYPDIQGTGKIIKLIHSPGHSAPLMKIMINSEGKSIIFYNPAFNNAYEGQEIGIGKSESLKEGDIISLKYSKTGMSVYNIETVPGNGGKLIRSGGGYGEVVKKNKNIVQILMPSKKTLAFDENCRATIGIISNTGRKDKPFMKAGNRYHAMKARGKKWHFTSPIKMNAIDHPFGGGRGKRIKSKIAKRNAPPGAKVGHLRPRRTGKRK